LFVPTHTYDHPPENLEVLLVPGGPPSLVPPPAAIKFIERMYPRLKYIISVGTGSRFLGQAGVLDNRNATTSKLYWTRGTEYGKNVTWIAPARYVVDGASAFFFAC
jgi:putative intracellular protease/amidase